MTIHYEFNVHNLRNMKLLNSTCIIYAFEVTSLAKKKNIYKMLRKSSTMMFYNILSKKLCFSNSRQKRNYQVDIIECFA